MHRASNVLGVATSLLALQCFSAGNMACAQDEQLAERHSQTPSLSSQPFQFTDHNDREPAGAGPTPILLKQQAGWMFGSPADRSSASAGDDKAVDFTFTLPGPEDIGPDVQTFSDTIETTDRGEAEERSGPMNLQISKSLKIKAQPMGGGLGGRVTLTFTLPTGD